MPGPDALASSPTVGCRSHPGTRGRHRRSSRRRLGHLRPRPHPRRLTLVDEALAAVVIAVAEPRLARRRHPLEDQRPTTCKVSPRRTRTRETGLR